MLLFFYTIFIMQRKLLLVWFFYRIAFHTKIYYIFDIIYVDILMSISMAFTLNWLVKCRHVLFIFKSKLCLFLPTLFFYNVSINLIQSCNLISYWCEHRELNTQYKHNKICFNALIFLYTLNTSPTSHL